jgi:WD repeat-containing protein 35
MAGYFDQCSRAFMKLETLPDIPEVKRKAFGDLALSIFINQPPVDPPNADKNLCTKSGAKEVFKLCTASGLPIVNAQKTPVMDCRQCKHSCIEAAVRR